MWVYLHDSDVYTVGFFRPDTNEWVPVRDFVDEEAAMRYVNYLNGGSLK